MKASDHSNDQRAAVAESTAVRVALWRALHVRVDPPPHVLEDEMGLRLAAPPHDWLRRPDMNPERTCLFRASIVGRARFVEDLVVEEARRRVGQYVILGAGLDTFAQRRPEIASRLKMFEVDRPGPQAWKRQRLIDLGFGIPDWLRLVSVDFEKEESWWERLLAANFEVSRPAVVASLGVSMYLTQEAIGATLRQVARLAAGSRFVMSFLLPLDSVEPEEHLGLEAAVKGAQRSGTPFISFFTPAEMRALAQAAGFREARISLTRHYFAGRTDGLQSGSSEQLLAATV